MVVHILKCAVVNDGILRRSRVKEKEDGKNHRDL